jgi:hypothetical protein
MVASYGTDIPHLSGNFTRYLYGPGTILVAHGAHENLTVGDLETAVKGYEKLVLHVLGSDDTDKTEHVVADVTGDGATDEDGDEYTDEL